MVLRILSRILFAAGALAAAASHAASRLPGPAFPSYADAPALTAACESGLKGAAARVRALERRKADAQWPGAWDDLNAWIEDASAPFDLLEYVHPDKAQRDAAQACTLKWADLASTLGQNETLYRAAKRVVPRDAVDRALLAVTIEGFEDSGVGLEPAARRRAKALNDRIVDLGQQFDARIREENTKLAFAVDELVGVPEDVWGDKPRDDAGRVLLGLDTPTYLPVVERAERAATRERMWRAKLAEGGDGNLKLLGEIAALRREYAALFGFTSFADFTLRRRMVGDTATAERFLADVKGAVAEREKRDLAEVREAKAQNLGLPPEKTTLERWDVAYYSERLKQARYAVDQEAFRQHFPPEESVAFVIAVAERAFGLRYERVPAKLWHPDARAYAVRDAASGRPLAALYVDLYPREGKYNHAAVWPIRSAASRHGRTAQAALVVNLDRKGLSLDELETLLHEFGHAIHNTVSATRTIGISSSATQRDFVEAPSQMPEDWVFDPRVLKVFAEVCPACKPVPDALLAQAETARHFGKGIAVARQHLFAAYDLALHAAKPAEPIALWIDMERATPLGHVAGTMFPAGFAHIASNYAAGYYGYLWSLVLAHDLRTAFAPDRLDPAVGARYRATVLGLGRQRPPEALMRAFLGREPSRQAFFDDLKK